MEYSIMLIECFNEEDFSPCFYTKLNADGIVLLTIQEMIYNHFRDYDFISENLDLEIKYNNFKNELNKIYSRVKINLNLDIKIKENNHETIYFEKIYTGYKYVLKDIQNELNLYLKENNKYENYDLKFFKDGNYLFFQEVPEFTEQDIIL